ncbi:MAG: Eco57I restriction-modification methylase domain-containing protein, partial [Clostridium sp.]|nr:Eco57I restriction-modification methylase domain-containing protein [Clostridium sp.]
EEFPQVFAEGGFDIVIGSPPYGATLNQRQKNYLVENYATTEYNFDTYKTFFELGFKILKEKGFLGYITPNTFFTLELGANKLRKFLFDNYIVCKIVEVYNVFPTAVVEPVITIFKKQHPIDEKFAAICIPRKVRLTSTFLNEGVEAEFSQADLKRNGQYIFNYRSSKEERAICDKMEKSVRLDALFCVMTGAKPYQVGKGIPPQTREIVSTKPFTGYEKKDALWLPYMRGRTIDRYTNKWKGSREYIKYGEWLAEPRSAEVFKGKKLFIRETGDSLIATYDEGNVSNNTLHSIYPLESNTSVSLYYLLGLLNSKLLNWYYRTVNYLEIGKPMAEVKGIYIKKLPIAIGTQEQNKNIEIAAVKLLELCQRRYDSKYSFIHYLTKVYEPKKISDILFDFEKISFKDLVNELKRVKVKLSASQQKDLLELYEISAEEIMSMDKQIEDIKKGLDLLVFNVYKITDEAEKKMILA